MFNLNGSTIAGSTMVPLGAYAGYLLLHSENLWIAAAFLVLTVLYVLLALSTIIRCIINYRRNRRQSIIKLSQPV